MEKVLKVCKVPQGSSYVPGVRIAGEYLTGLNFNLGDNVIIKATKNKIVITKAENKDLLALLTRKNKNLDSLIDELGLKVA